jgi:hypothetical protein
MQWTTFEPLTSQHDAFVEVSFSGLAGQMNLLLESLDNWVRRKRLMPGTPANQNVGAAWVQESGF